jgi:hypothetical protein
MMPRLEFVGRVLVVWSVCWTVGQLLGWAAARWLP